MCIRDSTNPDRGFWHFGGGPWLTELPSGGESDDGPVSQNWYQIEIHPYC